MTTVASLHRRTLLGAASLGTLGIVGGSPTLIAAGALTLGVLAFAAGGLHAAVRTVGRRWAVHGATVLVLLWALVSLRTLQIDAVFIILMTGVCNRALLRASSRDDLLIVGGAAVLLIAATVVTSGLAFALILLAAVPTTAAALWTSTMLAGAEHAPAELSRLAARPAPGGLVPLGLGAVLLTLAGFGVSTLLPRYRFTPFLSAGAFAALSGSSDSMELTNDGGPDPSDGEAVLFVEPGVGVDQGMLTGLYARLYALDAFDGRSWTARTGGHFPPVFSLDKPLSDKPVVQVSRPNTSRTAAHSPVAVLGRNAPWAALRVGVHYDTSGTLVVDRSAGRAVEYSVAIGEPLPPPKLSPGMAAREAEVLRHVPDTVDPRIVALGRSLVAGADSDEQRIARVLRHFASGFRYSTAPLEGTAEDPLVRFLFESKVGHCELYAGAVALLLRVAGLESRVASGYYLGRWNDVAGFLSFNQGDAHAWVEVRTAAGWQWVDATPEDLRSTRDESVGRRLRDWYEAASALWFDNVVDYDARRQQDFYLGLSRRLDEQLRAWRTSPTAGLSALGGALTDAGRATSPLLLVPVLAAALTLGVLVLGRRRSLDGLGLRLRRALGGDRRPSTPLGALASELSAAGGRGEAEAAVALYERRRYAPAVERPSLRDVARAVARLEFARRRARRSAGPGRAMTS
jgi:transglutaminase-like putative cysteine protease